VRGAQRWFAQCGFEATSVTWLFPGQTVRADAPCLDCGDPVTVEMQGGRIVWVDHPQRLRAVVALTSDVAALLHNELLLRVWAIPSYLISARAYQTYLQLSAPFQRAGSTLFVLRKDFEEGFWRQFLATLNRFPGFALVRNARLTGIRLTEARDRVDEILVRHAGESAPRREKVRSLIVSIPPNRLLDVVRDADSVALRPARGPGRGADSPGEVRSAADRGGPAPSRAMGAPCRQALPPGKDDLLTAARIRRQRPVASAAPAEAPTIEGQAWTRGVEGGTMSTAHSKRFAESSITTKPVTLKSGAVVPIPLLLRGHRRDLG
jgi:hypothetical protein